MTGRRVTRILRASPLAMALLALPVAATAQMVVGPGAGSHPVIRLVEAAGDRTFLAFDNAFLGGVSLTLADINGDGKLDIIAGAGPGGGPHVKVFSGADLSVLASFYAYDPAFVGGVQVAAGDVNGDGTPDIITAAGPGGGPHVKVFSGVDLTVLASFYAYESLWMGGVQVAAGDVNGDGKADIITGAGPGGGPHVRVFSGADLTDLASFYAYDLAWTGGVNVAAGDINGDGKSDIITGAGAGGGPHVRVFSGADLTELAGFYAYDPAFGGGVLVAAGDIDGDGRTDLITGAGPGGGPHVKVFSGVNLSVLASFYARDPADAGGVTVGSVGDPVGLRFTSAGTATFTVGSAVTFTVRAIGAPTPALSATGALPSGVGFVDNGDGTATLGGTPAAGTGGTYSVTFTAANGVAPNAVQTFTLHVNQQPVITSAGATTFPIGAPRTFSVATTGFPIPTITRTGAALPAGVTWVDNGNGTGTLSGTPAAGTIGTYAITFTATNTVGASAPQAFTLTVNGAPTITSAAAATFTLNTAGTTFQVVMTGSPAPTVSVTAGVLPTGLTLSSAGLLSGTPTQGGSFPVTLTATNGTLPNATQAFTVMVNRAPAITSAAATTFTVGIAGSFNVVMTGFPAPTVSVTAGTLPGGVTLTPAGLLSGTPDPGTGGTRNLTLTATNGIGANAVQAFTLTVNQAPSITSANAAAFTVGSAGTFTVITTGFPVAAIARTGVALPNGVTFVENGNGTGTLSGTPAAGTAGSYAITFTAANGAPPNAVQAFTLTVQQPPAITSAVSTTFTVGTPGTFTVTTTGFPTPTVSQTGTLPTGGTFMPATRVLGGTATQTGAFPLQFTAANGVPPNAVQAFTLNVVCPAITVNPATMPDGLYLTAYGTVDFDQTGSTGSSFTWSATGLPAGLTINVNTGVVSGTPTNTVLNAAVAVTVTDNFGCQGTRNTTLTVRPSTDNENYTGGVGNTQYAIGAPFPTTPHVAFVDNVKTGDNGPGALSVTFPGTSTNGGTIVEGTTDGTFIYTPALNFGGPTDTFPYTLTDGNGVTNTGTVTINLSNIVWYVNSSGGNGDGRSHNPFNTLASASTASGANSIIYVHTGGATTPGNLAMDVGQILRGQGGSLPFTLNGLTIPQGTAPTLTGTVTLGNATQVVAVNFTPTAIPALVGNGTTAVTIDTVNVTGGTNALSLTNATGVVNVTNSSFTNTTGAEVLISGGTANVNVGAPISSNAGRSIDIQGRTAGTVSFTGAITDTGQGIFLNSNTGSTINFSGGLSLSTGTNPGFTATGGGTVSATQNNTTIVNTIATTTGTALNVANTSIGANNLEFRSINAGTAASGPVNGIILNTTGGVGGLKVEGTGSAGSGGTIQRTSGSGMSLNSTADLALSFMNITNSGDAIDENGIRADNLSGTSSFTSLSVTNSFHANVRINNNTGTLNMTVTGSTFNSSTTHDGFDFVADPSGNAGIPGANMTLTMSNSNFNNNFSDGFDGGVFSNTTATLTPAIASMTLTTSHFDNNGANGVLVTTAGSGDSKFNIFGNTSLSGNPSLGVNVFQNNQSTAIAQLRGKIDNNPITYSTVNGGGQGILVNAQGAGTVTVEVTNNTINYLRGANTGMTVQSGDGGPGSTVVKLAGNTVNMAGIDFPLRAINVESGLTAASTRTVCLNAGSTAVNLDAAAVINGVEKLRVRKRPLSLFNIQGITPSPSTTAGQVQGFLSSVTGLATSDVFVSGPTTFDILYTNAVCSTAAAQ